MSFTRHLARPLAWAAFTASFLFLLSVTVLAHNAMRCVADGAHDSEFRSGR